MIQEDSQKSGHVCAHMTTTHRGMSVCVCLEYVAYQDASYQDCST